MARRPIVYSRITLQQQLYELKNSPLTSVEYKFCYMKNTYVGLHNHAYIKLWTFGAQHENM